MTGLYLFRLVRDMSRCYFSLHSHSSHFLICKKCKSVLPADTCAKIDKYSNAKSIYTAVSQNIYHREFYSPICHCHWLPAMVSAVDIVHSCRCPGLVCGWFYASENSFTTRCIVCSLFNPTGVKQFVKGLWKDLSECLVWWCEAQRDSVHCLHSKCSVNY